jgi:hypothetical protein
MREEKDNEKAVADEKSGSGGADSPEEVVSDPEISGDDEILDDEKGGEPNQTGG